MRESGYYWVRERMVGSPRSVAFWWTSVSDGAGEWLFAGTTESSRDDEVEVLSEQLIPPELGVEGATR